MGRRNNEQVLFTLTSIHLYILTLTLTITLTLTNLCLTLTSCLRSLRLTSIHTLPINLSKIHVSYICILKFNVKAITHRGRFFHAISSYENILFQTAVCAISKSTQNMNITQQKSKPFIFQIEVDFSKHSPCEQTHQAIMMVVQSGPYVCNPQ